MLLLQLAGHIHSAARGDVQYGTVLEAMLYMCDGIAQHMPEPIQVNHYVDHLLLNVQWSSCQDHYTRYFREITLATKSSETKLQPSQKKLRQTSCPTPETLQTQYKDRGLLLAMAIMCCRAM